MYLDMKWQLRLPHGGREGENKRSMSIFDDCDPRHDEPVHSLSYQSDLSIDQDSCIVKNMRVKQHNK
jgi:hypothetical protein